VSVLLGGKLAVQYTHENLSSMRAIANAYQKSSLRELNEVLQKYKSDLDRDTVINRHLKQLYQKLLEDNLLRLVKPYSQVELSHIAELIELDVLVVERKYFISLLPQLSLFLTNLLDSHTWYWIRN